MKSSMTKFAAVLLAAAITLAGCGNAAHHQCIRPLPAGYSLDSLTDCRVPASFSVGDFNWRGSNLTVSVYAECLYDVVEVSQMQEGDTLVYDGKPMVIGSLERKDGLIEVNGGLEQGGAWLMPYEGGTYRAVQFDDHSVYTLLGKKELMLDDNFVITDCGVDPRDSVIYVTDGQKQYLESLPQHRQSFSELDTKVLIENGLVTAIQRIWIP